MRSVILVRPETPENTGFIARLCENFGFSLRLVEPEFNLEDCRSTANNAQEILREASIFEDVEEAVSDLEFVVGTKPGKGIETREFSFRENHSIMFGPESVGLSNSELEKCDAIVHIDADYPSLNLSHAASIVMYEARKPEEEGVKSEALNIVEEKAGEKTKELISRGSPSESELKRMLGEL